MSTNIRIVGGRGISFASILTVLFLFLKLSGLITWPWIWVFCPMWIGLASTLVLGFCYVVFFLGIIALMAFVSKLRE